MTSQLFIAGNAGNARDFLWRRLAEADRSAVDLSLQSAPAESGLRWQAQQRLVVPA
jgi:protocatechuate 3,4-dioxygenase beta subunit